MKSNIKRILKKLCKVNFTSIMFAVISIISTTFAWFAYSNIVENDMKINVRSWKIDINEGESMITNKLEIDLDEFYPGMETVYKKLIITNGGDIPSMVSYKINSLRIYNEEFDVEDQYAIFEDLAQNYPFSFNFNLDKTYLGVGDQVEFSYSISWPLDSGRDDLDALWGNRAYDFAVLEKNIKKQDSSYEIRDSISLEVELVVEQYVENDRVYVPDKNYPFGKVIYAEENDIYQSCEPGTEKCVKYTVIDTQNWQVDDSVLLLPDPNSNLPYSEFSDHLTFNIYSFMNFVSNDVVGTQIVIPGLSNRILGSADTHEPYREILQKIKENDGYIIFSKEKFSMFDTDSCYWLFSEESAYNNFAVKSLDDKTLHIYYEPSNSCKLLVPYLYTK